MKYLNIQEHGILYFFVMIILISIISTVFIHPILFFMADYLAVDLKMILQSKSSAHPWYYIVLLGPMLETFLFQSVLLGIPSFWLDKTDIKHSKTMLSAFIVSVILFACSHIGNYSLEHSFFKYFFYAIYLARLLLAGVLFNLFYLEVLRRGKNGFLFTFLLHATINGTLSLLHFLDNG